MIRKKERQIVEKRLNEILPKAARRPRALHRAMRYSVFSGGKRLRPIMAIEACKLCGGKISNVINAACALEMIHTYSLIHDDLPSMDNDDYRRGKPSCHKKFGEATAILAGDSLLTHAFCALSMAKKADHAKKAIRELSIEIGSLGMVGGQEMDLKKRNTRNENELKFIAEHKTAALFKVSLRLGAIFGGAGAKEEDVLCRFGKFFGIAFQLADDAFDDDGYAGLIGRKKTWEKAKEYMKRAKNELKYFGKKGERLKSFADFVVNRKDQ